MGHVSTTLSGATIFVMTVRRRSNDRRHDHFRETPNCVVAATLMMNEQILTFCFILQQMSNVASSLIVFVIHCAYILLVHDSVRVGYAGNLASNV